MSDDCPNCEQCDCNPNDFDDVQFAQQVNEEAHYYHVDYYTSLNKLSYAALKAIDVDPMHEVSDLFAEDCRSLGISYEYN
jgi:hypothetical protein